MVAEHTLHEGRQERADQRPGHAGEEAAQANERTGRVWRPVNLRAVGSERVFGNGHLQEGNR